ncbi:MAG: site-2 protease family protein, partial [Alphaproteobacteria bacterium]|nr:site-2 protease family protein [Alphaproteobacteria bacterium]
MITLISFVLVLGLCVLVHEWGHFYAARKSGIKVFAFS